MIEAKGDKQVLELLAQETGKPTPAQVKAKAAQNLMDFLDLGSVPKPVKIRGGKIVTETPNLDAVLAATQDAQNASSAPIAAPTLSQLLDALPVPAGYVKLPGGKTRQIRMNRAWLKAHNPHDTKIPRLVYTEDGGQTWVPCHDAQILGSVKLGSHLKPGHCTARFWAEGDGIMLVKLP